MPNADVGNINAIKFIEQLEEDLYGLRVELVEDDR